MTPDGPQRFRQVNELISIAGEDTALSLQIMISRHGPLIEVTGPSSDDAGADSSAATYALRWAGHDRDLVDAVAAGFRFHEVSDFEQFRHIVTSLGALDANWIYADSSGHIGYQLGTPIPVRPGRWGNFPVDGYSNEFEWQGYLPLDATPYEHDPQRGWLTSNNNAPRRDVVGNYAADRILRITQLLESSESLTVADLQSMQMDQTDAYLMRWKDEVVRLLEKCNEPDHAATIRSWDGSTGQDSWPTHFMNVFLSRLTRLTFEDELGELRRSVRKIWIDQVYNSTDSFWFDDINTLDVIETKEQVAANAIKETLAQTGERTWGEVHSLTMRHPMAVIPILGGLLDLTRGPWPRSGTAGTLCASFFRENDDGTFEDFVAPSWRFTIDFADVDAASIVLPAGNSGNPASDHFFDFNEMWQTGERWNVPISREKVRQQAVETLMLQPASASE
jgi:penicillin amidase